MSDPTDAQRTNCSQGLASERRDRGMRIELVVVLAVAVLPLVVSSVRDTLTQESAPFAHADITAGTLSSVLHCFIGLLLVGYVAYQRGDSPRHFGWRLRPAVIPGSLATFALAIGAYAAVYFLVDSVGLPGWDWRGGSRAEAIPGQARGVLLLLAVVSPVFEETVTRAYLMTRLRDLGVGATCCAVGSTLVQASYHIHKGLMLLPAYMAIFLVLSVCFARFRNLPVVVLAHFYIDIVWWAIA